MLKFQAEIYWYARFYQKLLKFLQGVTCLLTFRRKVIALDLGHHQILDIPQKSDTEVPFQQSESNVRKTFPFVISIITIIIQLLIYFSG